MKAFLFASCAKVNADFWLSCSPIEQGIIVLNYGMRSYFRPALFDVSSPYCREREFCFIIIIGINNISSLLLL